jgi:CMP-N-acetylneuraminic acid synthetase
VAQEYGGDAPFERPANLATDKAPTSPVITHTLDWLHDRGETFEIVCLVQATAPFVGQQISTGRLGNFATQVTHNR